MPYGEEGGIGESRLMDYIQYGMIGLLVLTVCVVIISRSKESNEPKTAAPKVVAYSGSVQEQYDTLTDSAKLVVTNFNETRKACNGMQKATQKLQGSGLYVSDKTFGNELQACNGITEVAELINKSSTGAKYTQ